MGDTKVLTDAGGINLVHPAVATNGTPELFLGELRHGLAETD